MTRRVWCEHQVHVLGEYKLCMKPANFRLTTESADRRPLAYYACDREHAALLKADLWGIGVDTTSIELIPS